MLNYEMTLEKLRSINQEHLLRFYDELDNQQKEMLLEQINNIDFDMIIRSIKEKDSFVKGNITPIENLTLEQIAEKKEEFRKEGLELIRAGKVAAVLLAGGQGTRLGLDKPKGMLNVGVNKTLYLFEALINNILDVVKEAGNYIHLFVMTSDKNHEDTVEFFEANNYFTYNKEYITFFKQEMAPATDYNGKVLLEEKGKVALSPNGNGGWYMSMAKHKVTDILRANNIEWLNVFSVDNVLQRICDPLFVGATSLSGFAVGAKGLKKAAPDEKVGVLCLEDGKPSIVEYYELTEAMMNQRDEKGEYAYNFGVTLNYLFRVNDLNDILGKNMPPHVVEKKVPYINEKGELIKPETPNGYKFETLVLDMIHMLPDCLPFEIEREKEFAPIKNKEGIDSLVTARELLRLNGVEI